MKVVCLIRLESPLIYFVNKINESVKLALAVVEHPPKKGTVIGKLRAKDLNGIIYSVRKKLLRKSTNKRFEKDCNKYFSARYQSIDNDIPILAVNDINSQVVFERLQHEGPDLILDHGTSLVKDHILETSRLALNLHWGLSPYYRGTYCTDWAVVNWDPYNIGVTIHKLTKIIDGGSILAQRRAIIESTDTVHSINMQLTKMGTDLIINVIDKMNRGEQLRFYKQDFSAGFLTRNMNWSHYMEMQVHHIEKHGLIADMLQKPSRKARLPTIEF